VEPTPAEEDPRASCPWAATRDEAIASSRPSRSRGRMRVGGELMASRDAIARLEREIALARAMRCSSIEPSIRSRRRESRCSASAIFARSAT